MKKAAGKEKAAPGRAKKRSQKVNKPADKTLAVESPVGKPKLKVICFNKECKLRRAGCYGYEACPGYTVKD